MEVCISKSRSFGHPQKLYCYIGASCIKIHLNYGLLHSCFFAVYNAKQLVPLI